MQNLATQKKDLTLDSIKDLIFKSVGNGSSWISSCKISFDKSYLYITAENQFSCDVIKGSYFDVLNSVAKQFSLSLKIDTSKDITTELTVANDLKNNNYIPEKIESKKTSSFDDTPKSRYISFMLTGFSFFSFDKREKHERTAASSASKKAKAW
mgnify:CR=1 FL=1